jgi:hypothetical protein
MKRTLTLLLGVIAAMCLCACGSGSGTPVSGVVVNVTGAFQVVEAGGSAVTLTASESVTWTLSAANTNCSPACGTLKPSGAMSATYTPPSSVPVNQQATITARSLADNRQVFAFNFQITPPIQLSIAPKFASQTAGGPVVDITATISSDVTGAGVTWTLTAAMAACSLQCGTLTVDPAPSLTAHYLPPASVPAGALASPTITAASAADPSKTDSFSFTIVAPPISVSITNKFSSATVGGPAQPVNVTVTNDGANAGVTWTLASSTGPCAPGCGTLTPSPAPSLSASFAPPAAAPSGADVTPTITATSVTDPSKGDSFSFSIVNAISLFKGNYAFQLRGFDAAGTPMAVGGSISSNGSGSITGGELDLNENGTATNVNGISGSYTVDTSFQGIPRITINLASGPNAWTLKAALSTDGTRGRIIEEDSALRLNAGSLLQQDPAALTAASTAGTYVFGLDSDVGTSTVGGMVSGRIVEAGRFSLAADLTSVTGGIADAGQSGAPAALFGGTTPAAIASAAATPPDGFGRGTVTLSINGNSNTYVYYVVNSEQLNLIETDSGGTYMTVQSGTAQRQMPLTADSINATSVAAFTGTTMTAAGVSTSAIIGLVAVSGGAAANTEFEFNSAGNVPPGQSPVVSPAGSVFSYDPSTGRAVLLNTFFFGAAVYLSDTGKGYIIDITPQGHGVNQGFSGPLIPQAPGPFSLASHIVGNSIGIAGGSSTPALPNFELAANFAGPDGAGQFSYSAEIDFTNANQSIGANGQAQNVSIGGAINLVNQSTGRGMISFPAGAFGDFTSSQGVFASYYIIGPHQFVALGQGPGGLGGDPSGILFFDPD